MSLAIARRIDDAGMSADDFRDFQSYQPDGKRWELIAGHPVMVAPPKIVHQRIAGNLCRLLDDALEVHDADLYAVQRPGVDLGPEANATRDTAQRGASVPEPDVAVIPESDDPDQRIVTKAILLAEVVSSTDERITVDGGQWIDEKAERYRLHPHCRAVLVIQQEKIAITLWQRLGTGWVETHLDDPSMVLEIECCGLRCSVGDVYARTPLVPRNAPTSTLG